MSSTLTEYKLAVQNSINTYNPQFDISTISQEIDANIDAAVAITLTIVDMSVIDNSISNVLKDADSNLKVLLSAFTPTMLSVQNSVFSPIAPQLSGPLGQLAISALNLKTSNLLPYNLRTPSGQISSDRQQYDYLQLVLTDNLSYPYTQWPIIVNVANGTTIVDITNIMANSYDGIRSQHYSDSIRTGVIQPIGSPNLYHDRLVPILANILAIRLQLSETEICALIVKSLDTGEINKGILFLLYNYLKTTPSVLTAFIKANTVDTCLYDEIVRMLTTIKLEQIATLYGGAVTTDDGSKVFTQALQLDVSDNYRLWFCSARYDSPTDVVVTIGLTKELALQSLRQYTFTNLSSDVRALLPSSVLPLSTLRAIDTTVSSIRDVPHFIIRSTPEGTIQQPIAPTTYCYDLVRYS